jgi:lysophospholipase L1-like esterase
MEGSLLTKSQENNNQLHSLNKKSTTKTIHKVKIIADRNVKGSATRVNQYVNTKFEICILIKYGAKTDQLVLSQEKELICLGRNDVIVINGGANDIDKHNTKENGILALMIHFIQKYANTNIIIVNIPHIPQLWPKTNFCIQTYNPKLKDILKAIKHVSLVEMSNNRRHFTKHGFHLNNLGKEWFAKQTALQIELQTKLASKPETVIPLSWKEETTNSERHTVESLISTSQTLNNKSNSVNNESICRISTTNKSIPPCIYNGHQSVGGSVWNRNEKRFAELPLNITKHPLPNNRLAPAVFAITELALVDLYGLVRTADLLKAAFHIHEHGLSAELAPVHERRTEAMLLFDKAGRLAAYDVICEKHNLVESEASMLKP